MLSLFFKSQEIVSCVVGKKRLSLSVEVVVVKVVVYFKNDSRGGFFVCVRSRNKKKNRP